MRHIIPEVREKLKGFESCRLKAYRDSAGVCTIGYGHTGPNVRMGGTISQDEADALLTTDLQRFEAAVEHSVKVPLTDYQFGALVCFAYNVGVGAFQSSTLLKKLNAGDYAAVPTELMKWTKAAVPGHKGARRELPGLVNRRSAEAGLWAKGSAVAGRDVPATKAAAIHTPATSPANWVATIGAGVPAVAAAVKGTADAVSSTFTQVNDSAGAVKNGVTVVRDTTGTWLGWINWHFSPVALAVLGVIGVLAVIYVVYRHSKLIQDTST
jgi:lysozyme